ncbi:unnamed protein product [Amoebophrya sp. A120]|nr:unnamed protein product [Amoebophrya sp. A120]|eukprot:GSA120T00020025001.1
MSNFSSSSSSSRTKHDPPHVLVPSHPPPNGCLVQIHGLTGRADLNGKFGVVCELTISERRSRTEKKHVQATTTSTTTSSSSSTSTSCSAANAGSVPLVLAPHSRSKLKILPLHQNKPPTAKMKLMIQIPAAKSVC